MKQIVFYCSGRNELPPPRIDGIQFFPERASMWNVTTGTVPIVTKTRENVTMGTVPVVTLRRMVTRAKKGVPYEMG